jgi:gamma-glutamylcyclotransferase (GGCT)/AIG2-like uncharacterized protein YtfP
MADKRLTEPTACGLLFAYGTLGPAYEPQAGPWTNDAVHGRLYDLGRHPILVDCDDAAAGWVEGHVRSLRPRELEERLDPYEGIDEGLFRRTLRTTRAGRTVWVYIYTGAVPAGARGPLSRWDGPSPPVASGP